jgi:hypothetical protein
MKTCSKCCEEKPLEEFNNSTRAKDGKMSYCRACHKDHYRSNRVRHGENVKKVRDAHNQAVREWKYEFLKEAGCSWPGCDVTEPIMLEFDHIESSEKEADICSMIRKGKSLDKIKAEAAKCQVLCANHHKLRTAKQMGWWSFKKYSEV